MIAALLPRQTDRETAARAAGNAREIRFCVTARELEVLAGSPNVTAVVCELHDGIGADVGPVARALQLRATQLPFLVVVWPSQLTVRRLARMLSVNLDMRVVLRDADDFASNIAALSTSTGSGSAHTVILRRLEGAVPSAALEIALACILLGFPKSDVPSIARVFGVSGRTIERRLATAGTLTARTMLAWSLALNVAWRMERDGLPFKRIAGHSGFPSREGLANAVRRACGYSPGRLVSQIGFDALLDLFCERLRSSYD